MVLTRAEDAKPMGLSLSSRFWLCLSLELVYLTPGMGASDASHNGNKDFFRASSRDI